MSFCTYLPTYLRTYLGMDCNAIYYFAGIIIPSRGHRVRSCRMQMEGANADQSNLLTHEYRVASLPTP